VLEAHSRGVRSGRFSHLTAQRVLSAARQLGYHRSEIGRSLRTTKSRIVAFIVPDVSNDFCADVAVSLQAALRHRGLAMMLCNSGEDPEVQDEHLAEMKAFRVTAVVMLGAIDTPGLRIAVRDSTPFVFVNRRPPKELRGQFVGIDNHAAGREVAEYFLENNYTECAIIHGLPQYGASAERAEGFIARLQEAGIDIPSTKRVEARLTIQDGYEHGKRFLAHSAKPRAVFCGNDQVAYGVYRACVEQSLRVHQDLAIFGFDDSHVNSWLAPWLNTVHVPAASFGTAVTELLSGASEGRSCTQKEILLPFELKIRQTA
jgi:LacI family transcriptional regulator